mgnify:FL=1
MDKKHYQTKTSLGDFCLFYGFPGVAILAVSLIVAAKIGAEFGGDGMIKSGTFLGCNMLLWLCYYTVFISLPGNLFDSIQISQKENGTVEAVSVCTSEEDDVPELAESSDDTESEPEPELEPQPQISPLPSEPVIPFDYRQICLEYEQRQAEEKAELVESIIRYAGHTMSPFVSEESIASLCNEIRCWCLNPGYKPYDIALRVKLSTNDLCHFIWNIGERLGRDNGYDGECRANFTKRLFASTLSKVDIPTLRNMTKTASSDKIPLDRPLPGSLAFRCHTTENSVGQQLELA